MKKIIAPILALVLAFGLGIFVRSERVDTTSEDGNSFVVGDGQVSAEPLPAVLLADSGTSTPAVTNTAIHQLLGGSAAVTPTILTYVSPLGFAFSYDRRLQTENAWIVLTGGYRVSSLALVRYVKEQQCGLSGLSEHCRPFLENPAIAFGVIEKAPKNVVREHIGVFAEYLEPVTINGVAAAQYYAGVEGEGVVTILVPLKNPDHTLLIQYTYDTLFDDADGNPDILKAKQQKMVVDSVLNTLAIQ